MAPAGFWRRFAAYVLDIVILMLGISLLAFTGTLLVVLAGVQLPTGLSLSGDDIRYSLAGLLVYWLYFALQESSWKQATVGKRLIGIEVTDLAGERISFGRATGRFFAAGLSGLTLMIGYLMAGFTARKQALHDMAAGTLVVRTPGASTTTGWVLFVLVLLLLLALPVLLLVGTGVASWQAHLQRADMPPVLRTADDAAAAIERYFDAHHDFPMALEDTGFIADATPGAPLVSVDPYQTRLTVAAADGSLFLVMTPLMMQEGLEWMCNADPDEPDNYPPRCRH